MAIINAQASALNQPLPPNIFKRVSVALATVRKMGKLHVGNMKFGILVGKEKCFVVNRGKKHCDCRKWDISEVPCGCSCKALKLDKGHFAANLVDDILKTPTFKNTYGFLTPPVPNWST